MYIGKCYVCVWRGINILVGLVQQGQSGIKTTKQMHGRQRMNISCDKILLQSLGFPATLLLCNHLHYLQDNPFNLTVSVNGTPRLFLLKI
jgi:hypothetical protein